MTNSKYKTGVYVKGDQKRRASTASDAVALVFDGFKLDSEDPKAEDPKPEDPKSEVADSPKGPNPLSLGGQRRDNKNG